MFSLDITSHVKKQGFWRRQRYIGVPRKRLAVNTLLHEIVRRFRDADHGEVGDDGHDGREDAPVEPQSQQAREEATGIDQHLEESSEAASRARRTDLVCRVVNMARIVQQQNSITTL